MPERCPTCFSRINVSDIEKASLLADDIYTWTDDPIYTTPAVSTGYTGYTVPKASHITELQNRLKSLEADAGVSPLTTFSSMSTSVPVKWKHIKELRDSVEKIYVANGITKTGEPTVADLDEFFNYDDEGIEHNVGDHQTDWYEPNITTSNCWQYVLKARHIEDLRHHIDIIWKETWKDLSVALIDEWTLTEVSASHVGVSFTGDHDWGTGHWWDRSIWTNDASCLAPPQFSTSGRVETVNSGVSEETPMLKLTTDINFCKNSYIRNPTTCELFEYASWFQPTTSVLCYPTKIGTKSIYINNDPESSISFDLTGELLGSTNWCGYDLEHYPTAFGTYKGTAGQGSRAEIRIGLSAINFPSVLPITLCYYIGDPYTFYATSGIGYNDPADAGINDYRDIQVTAGSNVRNLFEDFINAFGLSYLTYFPPAIALPTWKGIRIDSVTLQTVIRTETFGAVSGLSVNASYDNIKFRRTKKMAL